VHDLAQRIVEQAAQFQAEEQKNALTMGPLAATTRRGMDRMVFHRGLSLDSWTCWLHEAGWFIIFSRIACRPMARFYFKKSSAWWRKFWSCWLGRRFSL